jgi:hypothetical protein
VSRRRHVGDVTRELARRRVALGGEAPHLGDVGVGPRGRDALGEDADRARRATRGIADDVVVQHRADVGAGVLLRARVELRAVEPLLLAGGGHEDERGVEPLLREDARELQHDGDSRGVVVGAGRIARRVHDVGRARVVVADDVVAAPRGLGHRAGEHGDDVLDVGVGEDPLAIGRLRVGLEGHLHRRAGAGALELGEDPQTGGADAARGGLGVGEGVAGAEGGEGIDVALHARGVDGEAQRKRGRRRVSAAERREDEEQVRGSRHSRRES